MWSPGQRTGNKLAAAIVWSNALTRSTMAMPLIQFPGRFELMAIDLMFARGPRHPLLAFQCDQTRPRIDIKNSEGGQRYFEFYNHLESRKTPNRFADEKALSMSDGPELVARSVCVRLDGSRALSDIALDAPRKRIIGLTDPNGAGKTTRVNVPMEFQPAVSGPVGDETINSVAAHKPQRSSTARKYQSGDLFRDLPPLGAGGPVALLVAAHMEAALSVLQCTAEAIGRSSMRSRLTLPGTQR